MKICPNCGARFGDENRFCTICGTPIPEEATPIPAAPNAFSAYYQPAATVPVSDPFDHSEEFDEADIHSNKLYAMAVYLLGLIGIALALLGAKESGYVRFQHSHSYSTPPFTYLYAEISKIPRSTILKQLYHRSKARRS